MSLTFKPDLKATERVWLIRVELHGDVAAVDHNINTIFATEWFNEVRGQDASVYLQ